MTDSQTAVSPDEYDVLSILIIGMPATRLMVSSKVSLISSESKGIPLAYEMSRESGIQYIVARKMAKLYMKNPMSVDVKSITTASSQKLWLDSTEADFMKDKRIVIVDDVISTGESLAAVETLVNRAGGKIVAKAAVLAEGDAAERHDIIYLEKLPLFFK